MCRAARFIRRTQHCPLLQKIVVPTILVAFHQASRRSRVLPWTSVQVTKHRLILNINLPGHPDVSVFYPELRSRLPNTVQSSSSFAVHRCLFESSQFSDKGGGGYRPWTQRSIRAPQVPVSAFALCPTENHGSKNWRDSLQKKKNDVARR